MTAVSVPKVTVSVPRRMLRWLVIMVVVSPLVFSGLGWWYVSYKIAQNNRKLCQVLAISDRPIPPASANQDPAQRARQIKGVKLIHQLRIDYGCIEK